MPDEEKTDAARDEERFQKNRDVLPSEQETKDSPRPEDLEEVEAPSTEAGSQPNADE